MHFGLYLKNKGIITADQLVAALEVQLNALTPIGQLALEEGIIAPREIFDVLRAQRETPGIRFGDLAVEMGFMTRGEVSRLLMIQIDRKRPVEEILVSQGIISAALLTREMAEFRRSQTRRRMGSVAPSKIVPAPRARKSVGLAEDTMTLGQAL